MAQLDQVLIDLVKPMVNDPEKLSVTLDEAEDYNGEVVLHVSANSDDIARLIGRRGMMASALRQVMGLAAHADARKISIKFDQIEEQ